MSGYQTLRTIPVPKCSCMDACEHTVLVIHRISENAIDWVLEVLFKTAPFPNLFPARFSSTGVLLIVTNLCSNHLFFPKKPRLQIRCTQSSKEKGLLTLARRLAFHQIFARKNSHKFVFYFVAPFSVFQRILAFFWEPSHFVYGALSFEIISSVSNVFLSS